LLVILDITSNKCWCRLIGFAACALNKQQLTNKKKISIYEIFEYDKGNLFWKIKPSARVNIGDLAGYLIITKQCYKSWQVRYNKIAFIAARIIWEMFNGAIPEGMEVDHIDRDSLNRKFKISHKTRTKF